MKKRSFKVSKVRSIKIFSFMRASCYNVLGNILVETQVEAERWETSQVHGLLYSGQEITVKHKSMSENLDFSCRIL